MHRLFFALWPENSVRDALKEIVRQLRPNITARWIEPENLHITLAFLGDVATGRLPDLAQAAETVSSLSSVCVDLSLDRVEHWRKPQVICLTPSTHSPVLGRLAANLSNNLRDRGFQLEARPYRAHVTLAHKASTPPMGFHLEHPINWKSSYFVLVESAHDIRGSHYTPLQSWPLHELMPPSQTSHIG
ncbi:MAG: RNA 2',3'-cyclic phosphodiesterase [Candidatus Methylumidiphilus sp.]